MRKLTLEEAKNIVGETLYKNGETFSKPSFGRGWPNLTFMFKDEWHIDGDGHILSPLTTENVPEEIKEALKINFKDPSMMFGDYFLSKNNKGCFKLKSPEQAKHILIETYFKKDPFGWAYREEEEAKEFGAVYYRSTAIGKDGYEYFIFPMELVRKSVSEEFLKSLADEKEKKFEQMEKEWEDYLKEKEESIKNKALLENRLIQAEKSVLEIDADADFSVKLGEYDFLFKGCFHYYYNEKNVQMVESIACKEREKAQKKEKFLPLFKEIAEGKDNVTFYRNHVEIRTPGIKTFNYTEEELKRFRKFFLYNM